jgi:hypothetical protein
MFRTPEINVAAPLVPTVVIDWKGSPGALVIPEGRAVPVRPLAGIAVALVALVTAVEPITATT